MQYISMKEVNQFKKCVKAFVRKISSKGKCPTHGRDKATISPQEAIITRHEKTKC